MDYKDKALLFGFMVSNVSALIYEVVWSKQLTYVFGTSVYAVSTVLATFMFGLALGSFLLGKFEDKLENPMRVFAGLEIGIGVYGVASVVFFDYLPLFYLKLSDFFAPPLFPFVLFILSFLALLIPTVFIGATFPVVSKIYAKDFKELGKKVGVAYSLDTLGAAVGSLASGFILLPFLGLDRTTLLSALLNLGVGVLIFNLARETKKEKVKKQISPEMTPLQKTLVLAFFLSGLAALAYEVIWTRFLSWVFSSSVYAFSSILGAFLLGLAIGSYLVGRIVDEGWDLAGMFALVELGIAASALTLLLLFSKLDELYLQIFLNRDSSGGMFFIFFLVFFLLFLVPSTLMGATMPIVTKIYSKDPHRIGGNVGTVFSCNTLGGMFGSFLAGFILVPIGVEGISILAAGINILVGVMLLRYSKSSAKKAVQLGVAILLVLIFSLSTYETDVLGAGIYYNARQFSNISDYQQYKAETQLLFKRDDPHGLVTVTRGRITTALHINGKIDAGDSRDIPTEYMLAYAPMFTHEEPKKVLIIGLGGGFTLSAIEDFNVEEIDVVEINPAVAEATSKIFYQLNDNALNDSRVNLIIADARNYLLTSEKKYDIIISEPSNPWLAGEGGLFTKEFYELVRRHLYEGGIFSQWVPLYDHRAIDFKVFLKTFQYVFPNVQVYNSENDAILVGSQERKSLDYPKLKVGVEIDRVRKHLLRMKRVTRQPSDLRDVDYYLSFYMMNSAEVSSYITGTQEINTDDRPLLDFRTAKVHIMRGVPFEEQPRTDIANFKLKREAMVLSAPPLTNVFSIDGRNYTFDLFGIAFENVDWNLLDVGYWQSRSVSYPNRFDVLRSVIYETPLGEMAWIRLDGVSSEADKDGLKLYLANSQNVLAQHLHDEGEMKIDSRDAYLFTDGVKLFAAWQCVENKAIYILLLPYTNDTGKAKEIFGHAKCIR